MTNDVGFSTKGAPCIDRNPITEGERVFPAAGTPLHNVFWAKSHAKRIRDTRNKCSPDICVYLVGWSWCFCVDEPDRRLHVTIFQAINDEESSKLLIFRQFHIGSCCLIHFRTAWPQQTKPLESPFTVAKQ